MKPKPRQPEQDDLLRPRLVDLIDMRHELVKLETLIEWEFFEREWAGFFPSGTGRPATSPRLVAGLLYLQHTFELSNPYYQHLCGETFFQHRPPHPTDARLYETARRKLVVLAAEAGIELRQSYARLAPRLAAKAGRYAHARQFKRMRKVLRTPKGYTVRVMRDLRRRLEDIPEGPLRERILDMLVLTSRLLHQQPKDKGKTRTLGIAMRPDGPVREGSFRLAPPPRRRGGSRRRA